MKCCADSFTRFFVLDPIPFSRNAKRRQAKSSRRDARNVSVIFVGRRAIRARPVKHQTRTRTSLLPKILKRTPLEVFEKYFISCRKILVRAVESTRRPSLDGLSYQRDDQDKEKTWAVETVHEHGWLLIVPRQSSRLTH